MARGNSIINPLAEGRVDRTGRRAAGPRFTSWHVDHQSALTRPMTGKRLSYICESIIGGARASATTALHKSRYLHFLFSPSIVLAAPQSGLTHKSLNF